MIFETNIDWIQLARFFSGESSPEEKAVIESRVDNDAQYRAAFEYAKKVWDATGKPTVGVDKQQAWMSIDAEVKQQEQAKKTLRIIKKDRSAIIKQASNKSNRHSSNWAVVSMLCIVVMVSLYFVYRVETPQAILPEVAVFKTTSGQRATVTLPDGSEAILNAESQIRVLTSPSDSIRVMELEGEAFFSVVSDPAKPFFVRAGEAEVKVVGTSFSVSAYPEQEAVHVLVTEGEVRLRKNGALAESMVLVKNDMGILASEGSPTRTRGIAVEKMLAWKDGILVFEHTRFVEVARTLERWFDLEIHISDPEIENRHLSTSFEDPTPNHVISIIASTLSLDYSIQESTVTFFIPERP